MDWINIHTSMLRAPEYLGSEPTARATWLNVIAWCCTQENSGRIAACKAWKDRQWQQLCGVTEQEINSSSPLLKWDGNDLIVWAYPVNKQAEVQSERVGAVKGGRSRSEAKIQASRANGAKHKPRHKPSPTQAIPKPEPNGMEGNGREWNGREHNLAPAEADAKARPRNELLDAFAVIGGGKAEEIVASRWSGINKALSQIKDVCPALTIAELYRRAANYRQHFPDAALTPFALASHWATCAEGRKAARKDDFAGLTIR